MDQEVNAATMDDFRGLSEGTEVRIFAAMPGYEASTWVHSHIERDLVFGALRVDGGPVLPVDAYLYDAGGSMSFSYGSQLDRPGGFALLGGTVYLQPPARGSRGALPAGRLNRPGKLKKDERLRFDAFVDSYAGMGFQIESLFVRRDRYWQYAPEGTFEISMKKGPARINLNVVKHPGWNPFASSRFKFVARDWSHRGGFLARDRSHGDGRRPIPLGTAVVRLEEIAGIDTVIAEMEAAVDRIVARASQAS